MLDYTPIVKNQLPEINRNFIIGEPVARNTAPCVAAAAAVLHREDPDSVMVVLPADHVIGKPKEFSTGAEACSGNGHEPKFSGYNWDQTQQTRNRIRVYPL